MRSLIFPLFIAALVLGRPAPANAQIPDAPIDDQSVAPTLPAWAQPGLDRPAPHPLSEDDVRRDLQTQGYYDIRNLRRAGGNFTADARRYGKQLSLTIDGRTGMATQTPD